MTDRIKRVNELLQREIATALYSVINEAEFDHAAVTVVRVEAARNLREARVWISIRAEEPAQHRMLSILRHHRGDLQQAINRDMTIKYTPRLQFVPDHSMEHGAHVLDVLREVEATLPPEETLNDADRADPLS